MRSGVRRVVCYNVDSGKHFHHPLVSPSNPSEADMAVSSGHPAITTHKGLTSSAPELYSAQCSDCGSLAKLALIDASDRSMPESKLLFTIQVWPVSCCAQLQTPKNPELDGYGSYWISR